MRILADCCWKIWLQQKYCLWEIPTFFFKFYFRVLNKVILDWLIIYCFTSRSRIFHLYGDVITIAGEGLQNLGLCSALRAFEQGGIFIVPHLLCHGASVFPISSEGPPHSVASYNTRGDVKGLLYSNPNPHGFRLKTRWVLEDWKQDGFCVKMCLDFSYRTTFKQWHRLQDSYFLFIFNNS
jgi:hypothetical protein